MEREKLSPFLTFLPSGRRGYVVPGKTIMEAAQEIGADIQNVCGGIGQCGKCKIRIIEDLAANRKNPLTTKPVSPIEESEKKFFTRKQLAAGWRLACQAKISGDMVVLIPDESRAGFQVISKKPGNRKIDLNPVIRQYFLSLPPEAPDDPMSDWERLSVAMEAQYNLIDLAIEYSALLELPEVIHSHDGEMTVFLRQQRDVVHISAGRGRKALGLAIDMGTTSLAVYLCDIDSGQVLAVESMVNPQIIYGEDVMSRIAYAMANPEGTSVLNQAIVQGINDLISNATMRLNVDVADIVDVVCVGNTCMHHLFLGCNPKNLGRSPFTPVVRQSMNIRSHDIGLATSPGAYVHLLPVIAGFVGADTVAVLIAEQPYASDEMTLIIDVGTNGELILGNRDRLICSSCATGPAFEGATIRHGMRAAEGAIESLRIDPSTFEVDFNVIGEEGVKAKGICGSGIIDGVAEMFAAGILKSNGQFNKDFQSRRLRFDSEGPLFIIAWPHETATGQEIVICLDDVRAIQMAKGAIYSAAKLMMAELDVKHLDKVILAGAFGSFINRKSAALIGLFPQCKSDKVKAVGNAAGDGALMALLNAKKRDEADRDAAKVEYVELTNRPGFQKEYAKAMYFPHMTDQFSVSRVRKTGDEKKMLR